VGWGGQFVPIIESSGATSLQQDASNHFVLTTGGITVTISSGGQPVVAGQFGNWKPLGAEAFAGGYLVVWKNGTADQYNVWALDSSGKFVSQGAVVAGASAEIQTLEPGFNQDFNGNGIASRTVIEAVGSTTLATVANAYVLSPSGSALGRQLRMNSTIVTVGQFGNWTPIAAEQAANGVYQVAWKNGALNQYIVWNVDSTGNFISQGAVVAGSTWYVQAFESSVHQDLNSDGLIGPVLSTIETTGSTSLTKVADSFFFNYASGGPQLKKNGGYVAAGQFGNWTPLGVEQAASGLYQMAWKNGTADQYVSWTVDSAGNYLGQGGVVSGSTWYVQAFETTLHQDLNGDGLIGPTTSTIETTGSTALTKVADSYFFNYASGGPQLKMNGLYVAAGQFGSWAPLGVEQAANGIYQMAWKNGTANQYVSWNVDSAGNYISQGGVVSGSTWYLEAFEPVLHQDLNNDGLIGPTTSIIEATGFTSLSRVADSYFFNYSSGGPQLKMNGVYVAAGQLGAAWTPIGSEAAGNGFWVAWKNGSADQYAVWETDGSGNYLRSLTGIVSGSSAALQQFESAFHQDLNSDGVVAIEAFGATKLALSGNNFALDPVASLGGPLLRFGGSPVTVNEFGANWTPIGAEQTPTGYRVAWFGGSDQYTVWDTDAAGNYLSQTGVVSGASAALESLEPSLQQDLNRDGIIAPVNTIESFGSTSLLQIANGFLFNTIYGPQLKMNGTVVDATQLGPWNPIAAEQVGSGYQVAFRAGSADLYTVWNTDSNGNYVSTAVGPVSGGNPALEALEPNFKQDLNRDGYIGVPGLKINIIYDSFALAAPQSFRDGIQAAVNILQATFLDPITVNIAVGYGEFGGTALENLVPANLRNQAQNVSLGNIGYTGGGQFGNGQGISESYSTLRSLLAADARDSTDTTSVSSLPNTTSLQGHSSFVIGSAQAKALGVLNANNSAVDGQIGMGRNFIGNVLIAGALHEITHAMGRIAGLAMDVFRYSSPGNHVFGGAIPAPSSYFSIDGGATRLADFGTSSDPGDFLNSGVQGSNDPFNESVGNLASLTSVDLKIMDVLGFDVKPGLLGSAGGAAVADASTASGGNLVLNGASTNPTLLSNYMAAAFVPPSAGSMGVAADGGLPGQDFLAKPVA
jgi:20S proteasome alpha/beta subunit